MFRTASPVVCRQIMFLFGGVTSASLAMAAPAWYIEAQGTVTAVAADRTSGYIAQGRSYNQSDTFFQQPSYSGSADAAARGDLNSVSPPDQQPARAGLQAADATTSMTVTLGSIHGSSIADATVSDYDTLNTYGGAQSHGSWVDNLTFHTSNPLGVDYHYSLTLDDFLSTSVAPGPSGTYTAHSDVRASARTELSVQQVPLIPFVPSFVISDYISQTGTSLTEMHPAERTLSGVLHVFDGMTLTFSQYLEVDATAGDANATAAALANDTAYFNLFSDDSMSSYTSASGTTYAAFGDPTLIAAVPEPEAWTLLMVGVALVPMVRRKRRG